MIETNAYQETRRYYKENNFKAFVDKAEENFNRFTPDQVERIYITIDNLIRYGVGDYKWRLYDSRGTRSDIASFKVVALVNMQVLWFRLKTFPSLLEKAKKVEKMALQKIFDGIYETCEKKLAPICLSRQNFFEKIKQRGVLQISKLLDDVPQPTKSECENAQKHFQDPFISLLYLICLKFSQKQKVENM